MRTGHSKWLAVLALLAAAALPAQGEQAAKEEKSTLQRAAEDAHSVDPVRYLIDTGPLRIRDQFPLSMGFLAFDPVGATVLERGEWQLDVVATLTNTFAASSAVEEVLAARSARQPVDAVTLAEIDRNDPAPGLFLVDGEVLRSAIALRRGFGAGVQLEVMVPVLDSTGGSLDGFIEEFHDTFGFDQAGRTGVARDRYRVAVTGKQAHLELDRAPGTVLGDVVVGAKFRLFEPTDVLPMHLALDAEVKLPTGDEGALASSGSTDFGVQLVGSRYFRTACLHGSIGLLRLGEWKALGIGKQTLPSAMLAYEQGLSRSASALVQVTVSRTPFRDLGLEELSRTSIQATLGFKKVFAGKNVLFVGATENIQNYDNSADIGFHLGFTRTFRGRAAVPPGAGA